MDTQIKKVLELARAKINSAKVVKDLDQAYIEIFGKDGLMTVLTKQLSNLPQKDRPKTGTLINQLKKEIEERLKKKRSSLTARRSLPSIDITAPGKKQEIGHLHLVSQAIEETVKIFSRLGFSLQSYPEVDWDWYAFGSLNMPKNHPARDDWETFFVKSEINPKYGSQVLTPHTSNGQVREMERVKIPPVRMLNISRCYRRQIDVSHTPMFHQFEGLLIDEDVSISHLKGTFDYFTTNFFGPSRTTRLRPHHFRFTEPSFEVDVTCGVCQGLGCRLCKAGWLELGGAGMVHPKVLSAGEIDPTRYKGFAFGWGIERTIAMKTNIPDIRFFYQNDIRFLEQF
ncbi:phenylalanine--tRNA ligase subunit alpha [Candidatus Curtissbacteria bacterium RIFCSPHIGHO2_01_FULL_41_44]|uniref:Phenylalanine--tRNA ligase alpha subunit n=1 Tax=Candidatus Curtissbacteria bacterium RIFCSPLOWO2_01_FULL_42_50 TaxID=1797730 RepID=A0A1F5H7H3_9BACT|nr:MAG: phenylalanine--tRNA ligase subunit alpha [Candidatus Curtissbacteria bacterium RIFCSPHIGHO2_01_FULL_41_44]OGD94246.1 MAG: phenylalanine--tRNA ligase subunit alpha [Candidatus Curtissbacteria bacterium RIFCSPHIGHO2_02_FULL_42_58]OGD97720.1 MAG: phenylalanine--tRNA ligase subunit alpha [Candidatus Curtissbacteria bacterium RIFCSPHIGHO2_12_FULL_42_33]OGE00113.1 MAG: phenylalanine--tRNA ligase subunit alpha [Candidatus Curtissbacteria bacterium RIFCSPLOWO2_01_FULL_42_50]OGE02038.1 MAG: phen